MARVAKVWVRSSSESPPEEQSHLEVAEGRGVAGDHIRGGQRQITIIERSAWSAACAELEATVDPAARRANVLVEGIELGATIGKTIQLGSVRIEVMGETTPCDLMDEMYPGLCRALVAECRGGVYGKILDDGSIRVGDEVQTVDR